MNIKPEEHTYPFKFSIIMAVYNSQTYLKQAIDSVIIQSIGFEENVQLIIVDDGSHDNSLEIAQTYKNRFPENIHVISQEHGGVSSARNNGLSHASGEYVNFLDSDDYLSEQALEKVNDHFNKYPDKFDLVSIPVYYFGRRNCAHELNYKYTRDGIINLIKKPNMPQISISSCFIRRECIPGKAFKESLITSADSLFINKLLLEKMRYGMVKNVKYNLRLRHSLNSLNDNAPYHMEYYIPRLKEYFIDLLDYCLEKMGEVPKFIQYTVIYDLQELLNRDTLDIFEENNAKEEFCRLLRNVLNYVDDEVILKNRNIRDSFLKNFIYYFKYDDFHSEILDEDVLLKIDDYKVDTLSVHKFWLNNIDIEKDNLLLEGDFTSYFKTSYLSIEALVKTDNSLKTIRADFDEENNRSFLSRNWQYRFNFSITVPLVDLEEYEINLRINYHKNGDNQDFCEDNVVSSYLKVDFKPGTRISKINNFFIKEKYILRFNDNRFIVSPYSTVFPFKFSVVMAMYNTQNYLCEAIDSVINQSLGFEENVELIIVDDGSTDSSRSIALDYQSKYPENIRVLVQENMGQAAARNNGIKHARGRYLNFLDSDDYLDENVLSSVYEFFVEHEDETDVVSIPQMIFGRFEKSHVLNSKFESTRVIDLVKEPNNPQLASNSAFFKRELFYTFEFPTNVIFSEDAILVNKILLEKKALGVISDVFYYYRKREDFSSTIDIVIDQKEYFTDKLKYYFMELIDYAKFKESRVPRFLQYMIAYDLQWLLQQPDLELLESEIELREFWYYLDNIVKHIDVPVIVNNEYIKDLFRKNFFLYLKLKDLHAEIVDDDVKLKIRNRQIDSISRHKLWLDIVEIDGDMLKISGMFGSYFNSDFISVQAVRGGDCTSCYTAEFVRYSSRSNMRFLGIDWQFKYCFDVEVPLDIGDCSVSLRVNYHKDGDNGNFSEDNLVSQYLFIDFRDHANMSFISNYIVCEPYIVSFSDNRFRVSSYSYGGLLSYEAGVWSNLLSDRPSGFVIALFIRFIYMCLYPFIRRRDRDILLFMDRVNSAGDNATFLYDYAKSLKDGNRKYFVISKSCSDYKMMANKGGVLAHKSLKHKLFYLFADKIVTSHPYDSYLNPFYSSEDDKRGLYRGLNTSKVYFLQHGVIYADQSDWLRKYDKNLYLFNTSSDIERESLYSEGYNYDRSIIQTLGLPRFDALSNEDKKIILIVPTWRNYLGNVDLLLASDYYNDLNTLLSDESFVDLAGRYGYRIVFKAHPKLEELAGSGGVRELFDVHEDIVVSCDEGYQDLLNESSLMITDYSSVFFDFAYLKKPVIYYQPRDDYHHGKMYLDFSRDAFGRVVRCESELLDNVERYLGNGCMMEDEFVERVDNFFKFIDKDNCRRVYDWICEH